MQQLEEDLNFIRSLPARPAMRTEDLQAEFDRAGNKIKDWINNVHIPELLLFQTEINTSIQTQIDTALTTIRGEMNTLKTTLEGEMSTLQETVNTALTQGLGAKTSYEDFVTESKDVSYHLGQSDTKDLTFTYSKPNYFPLAISSAKISNWYEVDTYPVYFETQQVGSAVVKLRVSHGNTAADINGTATVKILWVRVR